MHNREQDLLLLIIILLITSTAFLDDNVAEETISLQNLPAAGANTVQSDGQQESRRRRLAMRT
jgi:hypothetical protein